MSKIWQIAVREFVATVFTRAFIIGLLVMPALITLGVLLGPRLFAQRAVSVEGQLAVVDPTRKVASELQAALTQGTPAAELAAALRAARIEFAGNDAIVEALGAAPKIELIERPADADVELEKAWLAVPEPATRHLALAVIHANAVEPNAGETALGSYDLYVPPGQDQRAEISVHQSLREAIIAARVRARGLDRAAINASGHRAARALDHRHRRWRARHRRARSISSCRSRSCSCCSWGSWAAVRECSRRRSRRSRAG